jgi:hypothetical protein
MDCEKPCLRDRLHSDDASNDGKNLEADMAGLEKRHDDQNKRRIDGGEQSPSQTLHDLAKGILHGVGSPLIVDEKGCPASRLKIPGCRALRPLAGAPGRYHGQKPEGFGDHDATVIRFRYVPDFGQ